MLFCAACKIHISTKTDRCPLCQKDLPDTPDQDLTQTYPDFVPMKNKSSPIVNLVSLAAIVLILLSVAVNWVTWNGRLWSIIFSAHILYFWLSGLLTFKKNTNLGLKLMIHAIAITLLLIIINMSPFGTAPASRVSWSVSYAMPVIIIACIAVMDIMILKGKHRLHDYLSYQLILCGIGFIPLMLLLYGVAQPMYPGIIAAAFSLITIIGLIVFAKRIVLSEFARRLHL
jgi:hypothetical protein